MGCANLLEILRQTTVCSESDRMGGDGAMNSRSGTASLQFLRHSSLMEFPFDTTRVLVVLVPVGLRVFASTSRPMEAQMRYSSIPSDELNRSTRSNVRLKIRDSRLNLLLVQAHSPNHGMQLHNYLLQSMDKDSHHTAAPPSPHRLLEGGLLRTPEGLLSIRENVVLGERR
jgi:hypothetical protein